MGFPTAVPAGIASNAAKYPRNFVLDGEAVGDIFHAFDLLIIGPEAMRPLAFSVRYLRMSTVKDFIWTARPQCPQGRPLRWVIRKISSAT